MPLAHPSPAAAHEAEVVLRDGSTVHLRSVLPGDEPALRRFFEALSPESRHLRFFTGAPDLGGAARAAVEQATSGDIGLLATRGGAIVAHAICASIDEGRAEVAFAVAEELHGEGLATLLLLRLAEAAAERGIGVLVAHVLPANREMLAVFRDSGLATARPQRARHGRRRVRDRARARGPGALRAARGRRGRRRRRARPAPGLRRGHRGVRQAGDRRLPGAPEPPQPASAGVCTRSTRGRRRSTGCRATRPSGRARRRRPGGHRGAGRGRARRRPATARAKGVRALVVISAGFAETSGAGGRRQQRASRLCRASGMRLVGPNCLGVLNTAPDVRLDATFAPVRARRTGRVGFTVAERRARPSPPSTGARARPRHLHVRLRRQQGRRLRQRPPPLLGGRPATRRHPAVPGVVRQPARLRPHRPARRAHKPIVAVKSGPLGRRARARRRRTPGALLAASDVAVDALFAPGRRHPHRHGRRAVRRGGAARPPAAAGRATASRSSPTPAGPGILCADACEAGGLRVAELAAGTRRRLAAFLPATRRRGESGRHDRHGHRRGLRARPRALLLADPDVDAVIAIFIPPLVHPPGRRRAAVRRAVRGPGSATSRCSASS